MSWRGFAPEQLRAMRDRPEAVAWKLLEGFEALWREASAFVAAKWLHVQIVGDALAHKRFRREASEVLCPAAFST